jgi:hypothetical protein
MCNRLAVCVGSGSNRPLGQISSRPPVWPPPTPPLFTHPCWPTMRAQVAAAGQSRAPPQQSSTLGYNVNGAVGPCYLDESLPVQVVLPRGSCATTPAPQKGISTTTPPVSLTQSCETCYPAMSSFAIPGWAVHYPLLSLVPGPFQVKERDPCLGKVKIKLVNFDMYSGLPEPSLDPPWPPRTPLVTSCGPVLCSALTPCGSCGLQGLSDFQASRC